MDAQITILDIGAAAFDLGQIYALPQEQTVAQIALLCFCISLPNRVVLIDAPACPEDIPAEFKLQNYAPPPPLHEQLIAHQIRPEDVTDVIITHTHWDHYNGLSREINGRLLPTFPNAQHIINRADWNPDSFQALEEQTLRVVEQHGLLTLIDGQMMLDSGLTIIPAPGETPGHQIVELKTAGQTHYFCGDLYHHPIEFANPTLNVRWAETEQMQASKTALAKRAFDSDGLVCFSHIKGAFRLVDHGEQLSFQEQSEAC